MSWLQLIQNAVDQLDAFLKSSPWVGRENEVVNLFAHRFLASVISTDGPLRSMRQIGIEVAVRQLATAKKQYVRKDLVIWPVEDMTVWTGDGTPAVIVEWKTNDSEACKQDVAWLRAFCAANPNTLGVSLCATITGHSRGCRIAGLAGAS
jgi:hypothetical protein